jgi:hypothetical protein
MNSLRRPHHIRLHDLRDFVHKYDGTLKTTPEEWAKQVSSELNYGSLVFLLEPIAVPFGLTSFAKKDDDETFRVTDLAMVVRLENNKPMALNVSTNNYELRFVEALLSEKARKAILDQRKFCFVVAKPTSQLAQNKISALEKLSTLYAQGGSRRDFMSEEGDPSQEPVMAVLAACNVNLRGVDSSKQPLDLGSVCHLIFAAEGRQQDSNRSELKTNFTPVSPSGQSPAPKIIPKTTPVSSPSRTMPAIKLPAQSVTEPPAESEQPPNLDSTSEFLLNSWGQPPTSSEMSPGPTLFKRLADELAKKKPQQDDPLTSLHRQAQFDSSASNPGIEPEQTPQTIAAPEIAETKQTNVDEVYQHITEALSGLLDTEPDQKSSGQDGRPAQGVTEPLETAQKAMEPPKPRIEQQNQPSNKITEPIADQEKPVNAMEEIKLEPEASKTKIAKQEFLAPELENTAPVDFALLDSVSSGGQSAVFPASEAVPSKLDDFQEPKVVMTEMASLMHKLESQVARAAKKLTSRTSAIEQQLSASMAEILSTITQENKDTEAQLVVHGDSLSKQFESLFESLKAELIDKSASARDEVQSMRADQQKSIEENELEHHEALKAALNQNQAEFGQLVEDQENQLKILFKEETRKLHEQTNEINLSLQAIEQKFRENLSTHQSFFEKRIDEEMTVVLESLDNNTHIISKNIMISCQSGLEKLKKTKSEFENNLKYLVHATEIALDQQIRIAQIEFFLPRLKEHKQLIETMMQEMEETFAEKLLSQSRAQLDGLASSLASARAQLHGLMDECLNKLDVIGRNQQSGLEILFAAAADSLGKNTDELVRMLNQAEKEITDSDALCKKLVETYSLDNDPAVVSLRQNISNKVDSLKAQVKSELESAVNNDCAALEELIRNQHSKLNSRRADLAQRVHFASDHGLQRIRAAIHDAFNAVQSEREKYME